MTFITDEVQLNIPSNVSDLESFLKWAASDDFPREGRIWWLRGEVWADMSKEHVFSHVDVKTAIAEVLIPLARNDKLGRFFGDGLLLINYDADLAGNPDGMFVSFKSIKS